MKTDHVNIKANSKYTYIQQFQNNTKVTVQSMLKSCLLLVNRDF